MIYTRLRAFHAVAKCSGFSRGAEYLGLTQPAVSDQVRKLEDAYGVVLFHRRGRKVTLTQTGARLLEITRRLFEIEAQARDYLTEAEALTSGTLRIITDSAFHVLRLLERFRNLYPGIIISIAIGNSDAVLAALYEFEADIGVFASIPQDRRIFEAGSGVYVSSSGQASLHAVKLSSDPLVAFVAKTHRLAGAASITLEELSGEDLILRENGSVTRRLIEQAFAANNLNPKIAIEVEGREATREVVATGVGIGIVSQPEFGFDGRLQPIPISDCGMCMDEALVCLKERTDQRLIRAFLDCAEHGMSRV